MFLQAECSTWKYLSAACAFLVCCASEILRVQSLVCATGFDHLQVLGSIVRAGVIEVMHGLVGAERPPQHLLSDDAMFGAPLAVDRDVAVASTDVAVAPRTFRRSRRPVLALPLVVPVAETEGLNRPLTVWDAAGQHTGVF